jgi:hypothetical protein
MSRRMSARLQEPVVCDDELHHGRFRCWTKTNWRMPRKEDVAAEDGEGLDAVVDTPWHGARGKRPGSLPWRSWTPPGCT